MKYYFFGAGNNCFGALYFFGKENVIAIIDNNKDRYGENFQGVPLIDFHQFKKRWNNEVVIITAYAASAEIVKQLELAGIDKYYISPYMQSGFYSCSDLVDVFGLDKFSSLAIYGKNPISEQLVEIIKKKRKERCKIQYLNENLYEKSKYPVELLLITEEEKSADDLKGNVQFKQVFHLFQAIKKKNEEKYLYLEKLHNLYQGQSCFLIGTGPSLNIEDLEQLRKSKMVCFGCNRIFKIFRHTTWRPDYYVIGDINVYWDVQNCKENLPDHLCYMIRDFPERVDLKSNTLFYNSIGEKFYPNHPSFSDNLVKGVYGGRTVLYDMLQIAVYMGFKKIYLLGVDFSWGEDGRDSHFCKDYIKQRDVQEGLKHKDEVKLAYSSANSYAMQNCIEIFNATRGGRLEVFERVNFDELFYNVPESQ